MKTIKCKTHDDRTWYIRDWYISLCWPDDKYQQYPSDLEENNMIKVIWDHNECSVILNEDTIYDIRCDADWWASYSTCYSILEELEQIIASEWLHFDVNIDVSYSRDKEYDIPSVSLHL